MKSFLAFVLIFSAVVMSAAAISGLSYNQNAFASSPPNVTVTSPVNGATVSSSTVAITGTASSSSNTISTVQVSVDGAPYVTATGTTSWSYTATGLANGLHSITAKATDNQGLIGYSTNVVASSGVPVGNGGQELVYDPDNGNIYVANYNPSDDIVVVSGSTNQVLATIGDSGGPTGITYDSVNHYIYAANYDAGTVTMVNTTNNQVVGSPISVGTQPFGMAYVPNGDVYVANTGSNTVSVINPSTNTVVATIPVGSHPQDFAYDSTSQLLYMTNQGSNTVSVINPSTNTVVTTISVDNSPRGIAYDPVNGDMYVANFNSNTVSIINTSTNTASSISTGSTGGPNGVAFDPENGFVYVPDFSSATTRLNVIDTSTNTFINPVTLPSASYYYYAIFDPINSDIYITSGSNIAIVQTQTQFTVSLASTSTSVTSSQNPSTFGQSVSFTATITPSSATGNIVFTIDGVPQAPVTVSSGQAVFSSSSLSVGTHSITAAYSGDTSDLSSASSTLTQTVTQAPTSVSLISTVNPTNLGQSTTFTATINNTGTGSVTFMDGSNTLSTVPLTGNSASYPTSSLSVGSHSITAVYSGDTSFAGATSNTVSQVVSAPTINQIDGYAIFGIQQVHLEQNTKVVNGNVGVEFYGNQVQIEQNSNLASSSVVGDIVNLEQNVNVNSVYYNHLQVNHGDTIGTKVTPLSLPVVTTMPDFPSKFTAGHSDINVHSGSQTISAGNYSNISGDNGVTLEFTGGTYNINSLSFGNSVTLKFDGPTIIFIQNGINGGNNAIINPNISADSVLIYSGSDINIGQSSVINANMYALFNQIHFEENTQATGAFIASMVHVEQNSIINGDFGFPPGNNFFKHFPFNLGDFDHGFPIPQGHNQPFCFPSGQPRGHPELGFP